MYLYIVTNEEGTYLANLTKDNEEVFKKKGWEVLFLGISHTNVMLGILGEISLREKFILNKDMIKL